MPVAVSGEIRILFRTDFQQIHCYRKFVGIILRNFNFVYFGEITPTKSVSRVQSKCPLVQLVNLGAYEGQGYFEFRSFTSLGILNFKVIYKERRRKLTAGVTRRVAPSIGNACVLYICTVSGSIVRDKITRPRWDTRISYT